MSGSFLVTALRGARYETADSARLAEILDNESISLLQRALIERASEGQPDGEVLPIRAGGRR